MMLVSYDVTPCLMPLPFKISIHTRPLRLNKHKKYHNKDKKNIPEAVGFDLSITVISFLRAAHGGNMYIYVTICGKYKRVITE